MSSYLRWRVFCEDPDCGWVNSNPESREAAISAGKRHAATKHRTGEWSFRVQGIRLDVSAEPVKPGNPYAKYEPHPWEPHKTSRNKAAPCGRCGVYRYAHANMYGYAETLPAERRAAITGDA